MSKKPKKAKEKCCEKYLKSGRHCKNCPLLISEESNSKKKAEKKKKDKPGKKKKATKK